MEFRIQKGGDKANSKTLYCRKEYFWFPQGPALRSHVESSSGEKRGAPVGFLFRDHLFQSQDLSLPMCRKDSCIDVQEVPGKTHLSKGKTKRLQQGPVTWEEDRDTVQGCSNGVRYIKAHLKLNPVRDTKGNMKGLSGTTGISAT